ncbi:MAG: HDOD domain-containing protein [Hydrogenovibrio sp.]|nr:HDOD domain-containing protein [Hydrogenovibrio sp.]
MLTIQQQIEKAQSIFDTDQLPAMPKEIIKLNQMLSDPQLPEIKEVVQLISKNMNLAAEVIKTANLPMFSMHRHSDTTTIREAVDLIGLKQLKSMVMGIFYSMEYLGRAREEINHLSLNTAALCALLSYRVHGLNEEQAYLAGLFHNAGAILMANFFKDYDQVFMETLSQPYHIKPVECDTYNASRNVAGLLLAKKWRLSKYIGHVIYQAHKRNIKDIEDDTIRLLVALIQLSEACLIKSEHPDYYSEEVEQMYENANAELMISEEDIEEAMIYLFPHFGELG